MPPLPIQRQLTATPPPLPAILASASHAVPEGPSGSDAAALQCTPQHRPRHLQMPQSAPPPNSRRLQVLLTSPAAIRRSNESLEAIRVAQTLKAGFSRLKARADSQNSTSSAPLSQRAFSATSPPAVTPARRQLLSRHHSSMAFSRGSPVRADSMFRPPEAMPISRELHRETAVSPPMRPMYPSYSCPQRRQSLRDLHHQPSLLFPAPCFSLERAQSAVSSSSAATHSSPPLVGGSKGANKEVAEAAETMILFMRDSPAQSEERRTTLPQSESPSSPPCAVLPVSERHSAEFCAADLAPEMPGEFNALLLSDRSKSEYAPLSRSPIKRPRSDSSSSNAGTSLPSKRINIGH
ncbi:hypothetical protein GGI20_005153 [Coemansia sp. BCRC 34301]|nr:hypothetical protein GGI20_005153 [Coemansia sp. BCRC 34301]